MIDSGLNVSVKTHSHDYHDISITAKGSGYSVCVLQRGTVEILLKKKEGKIATSTHPFTWFCLLSSQLFRG